MIHFRRVTSAKFAHLAAHPGSLPSFVKNRFFIQLVEEASYYFSTGIGRNEAKVIGGGHRDLRPKVIGVRNFTTLLLQDVYLSFSFRQPFCGKKRRRCYRLKDWEDQTPSNNSFRHSFFVINYLFAVF
ncbi:hypothetical protein CDAR_315551 [Caerostris darwini]|uniref:Uncharacterized protein n=1 Tax=Caerostris darwini TaxID=1538125 RepID=A0AAV4TSF1_9ARAC|nr:hypothetical protein CDAR_315551 [Caerostris darwini]